MKAGNLILGVIALFMAGFGWILLDSGRAHPLPAGGTASLNRAIATGQPVLLEFYADWCGPCKQVAPELEELSREWTGKAKIVRVNVDEQPALSQQYGINGIPAFVVLRSGKEVNRAVGGMPKDMIRRLVF